MIVLNDVANLFEAMRTAYGQQWKHGADALPVWREALKSFEPGDLQRAASRVLQFHVDHPPTLPQFLRIVSPPRPKSTYIEAPKRSRIDMIANRVLIRELRLVCGVDDKQLKLMVDLKNALVEDCRDEYPPEEWVQDLSDQLAELASRRDRSARAVEAEEARHRFCQRQGIRYVPLEGLPA